MIVTAPPIAPGVVPDASTRPELVTVESRRGKITVPLQVTEAIRVDTVFVPYHWPERTAINQLTVRALDPTSKMPEFKVAAIRVVKV